MQNMKNDTYEEASELQESLKVWLLRMWSHAEHIIAHA